MPVYPIMLQMQGRLAVVIGGGRVALRKVTELRRCEACIRLVAPKLCAELNSLVQRDPAIQVISRRYERDDIRDAWIIIVATDDPDIGRQIALEADKQKTPINAVDQPDACSFLVPSVARRGDVVVAVSTSGNAPVVAGSLRRHLESCIPDDIETVVAAFRQARTLFREHPLFVDLDASARGTLLRCISRDTQQTAALVRAYRSDGVASFLLSLAKLTTEAST